MFADDPLLIMLQSEETAAASPVGEMAAGAGVQVATAEMAGEGLEMEVNSVAEEALWVAKAEMPGVGVGMGEAVKAVGVTVGVVMEGVTAGEKGEVELVVYSAGSVAEREVKVGPEEEMVVVELVEELVEEWVAVATVAAATGVAV